MTQWLSDTPTTGGQIQAYANYLAAVEDQPCPALPPPIPLLHKRETTEYILAHHITEQHSPRQ